MPRCSTWSRCSCCRDWGSRPSSSALVRRRRRSSSRCTRCASHPSPEALSLAARVALAAYNIVSYAGRTVMPTDLSPLYALPASIDLLAPRFAASAVVVLVVTGALVAARTRWPAGLAVWIAYVTMLLPVSGLFHTGYQITTDRYSYLPCLGFAMLAGGAVAMLLRAAGDGRLRPVVAQAATAAIA